MAEVAKSTRVHEDQSDISAAFWHQYGSLSV